MNELGDRIKKIRQALNLTQEQFAKRIGSVQNTITGYETGRRTPSQPVISLICKEFNVSEEWLRTGKGEMFVQLTRDQEIAEFVGSVLRSESDDFRRRFIAVLTKLDSEDWEVLEKMALEIVKGRD